LSRPHISGRALRAHPALLGASLTCAATLAVAPVANAPAAVGSPSPATPPAGASASPATSPIGVTPTAPAAQQGTTATSAAGSSLAQLIDPAPLPLPLIGVRLRIRRVGLDVLDGSRAIVAGALRPALAGRPVELQRLARHGWRSLAHTVTGAHGRFVLRYTPHSLLSERVRVSFAGDSRDRAAKRDVGHLRSYRLAGASWYGGGGSLACGGQLTGSTLGVANKTLPCGTLVTLRYGGREVSVPVVDRGPYVAGREFDLTEATKRALGFEGVGQVWSTR
jgi:rare lipoprotein A